MGWESLPAVHLWLQPDLSLQKQQQQRCAQGNGSGQALVNLSGPLVKPAQAVWDVGSKWLEINVLE